MLVIANLGLWIFGITVIGISGTMMASLCVQRQAISTIAMYIYWIFVPLLIASYVAMLTVVVQLSPDSSATAVSISGAMDWFGTRADWIATIFMLGIGHGRKLHITPSKEGVLALIRKVGTLIRQYTSAPILILIKKLNQIIRGWANYHRHVVASESFRRVDNYVYEQLWRMLRKRYSNKSSKWLSEKYLTKAGRMGIFTVIPRYKDKLKKYQVIRTGSIGIKRHRKIKADANPYLPDYGKYF